MLLSAFGQRRLTRDIDLLAKATSNEPRSLRPGRTGGARQ